MKKKKKKTIKEKCKAASPFASFENQAEIRGTLLYHKANEKSTLINPSYIVYYRQLCLADIAQGVKVTQKNFIAPFITKCTIERQKASTKFEQDQFKKFANSTYGKTIQNVQNYINLNIRYLNHSSIKYLIL